jgi:hypothetical protein
MTKLRDHLGVDRDTGVGRKYQLLLPFDQPIELEVRVSPQRADTVQFEVQLKEIAS